MQLVPQLFNKNVNFASCAATSVSTAALRAAHVAETAAAGWRAEAENMRKVAAELQLLAQSHLVIHTD